MSSTSTVESGGGEPGQHQAYRIGQTQRVLVHKFITTGSLEEKIDRMIQRRPPGR